MDRDKFVIGVDFGTDSVRSILADARSGAEIASAVFYYPRWRDGLFCNPSENQFRQHPLDYTEGLEYTIKECLRLAGGARTAASVKGISADTTGSTPVAVDVSGTPLSMLPGFETNPNAMFVLWKDHTSLKEAAELNLHARNFDTNYLQFVGGVYSSEWFWAKLLHILRVDAQVRKASFSWVEHCDWIPFLLTGGTRVSAMKRGVCAAGHKALWAKSFPGLPPETFFSSWDPLLAGFRERLFTETYSADTPAGFLSPAWAEKLGLSPAVTVGVGAFDAHMGAVGGQIEPYHLSKVMGTSTCDMLVAPLDKTEHMLIRGICGQVPGSIIPGMMGMEAGQSAFGDTYAWFRDLLLWPLRHFTEHNQEGTALSGLTKRISDLILPALAEEAAKIPPDIKNEWAVDWLNGRRTPDANQSLKAAIGGLSLGSHAPAMFRALAEATCFGAKMIVDRFNEQGIAVQGLIGLGGVARKSSFIMQMMADIMEMPIRIHRSEQTCAAGAAMFATVAAGIYQDIETAMNTMGQGFDMEYTPDPALSGIYRSRYDIYQKWGNFIEQDT
ncbi:MAG TPA: ribulokinase [Chitinophagaceae bacterium]|nr:ribulokinase [Chitinophagaceae bacterium]